MILGQVKSTTTFPLTRHAGDLIPWNYFVMFREENYCKFYINIILQLKR